MLRLLKKMFRDVWSTVYDDFQFKYMSLPRLGLLVSIIAVVVSWIGEQFFGYKFQYFAELVKLVIALATAYVAKKWTDKGREYKDEQNSGS